MTIMSEIAQNKQTKGELKDLKMYMFPKQNTKSVFVITFVSSEALRTYVNLFSLRGRFEPDVFPALPTRCIARPKATILGL